MDDDSNGLAATGGGAEAAPRSPTGGALHGGCEGLEEAGLMLTAYLAARRKQSAESSGAAADSRGGVVMGVPRSGAAPEGTLLRNSLGTAGFA